MSLCVERNKKIEIMLISRFNKRDNRIWSYVRTADNECCVFPVFFFLFHSIFKDALLGQLSSFFFVYQQHHL